MFDPHRIGPISESYYSRNKGRVLQRKLVPPINPPLTKYDLDRAYEVLKNNGRIPDYSIQDTIVNYPGGTSTKRVAYEIGSTIKVNIPIFSISISDVPGFIPLTNFSLNTSTPLPSIDGTHYYVLIVIEPNSPQSNYTEIYVNYLHQSSLSRSGTYYYYLYDFGTTFPSLNDRTVGFFTSDNSLVFYIRETNFEVSAPSVLIVPNFNYSFNLPL